MSKHTPGPWDVRPCSHGGGLLLRGDSRSHDQHSLQIVPMADARLIAAAPELLDALRGLLAACEGAQFASDPFDAVDIARAALAKANGEGSR